MKQEYMGEYEFDDDLGRLDYGVLEAWLGNSYWSPRIKAAEIEKGAMNSTLVLGCYRNGRQVGYMRLVSDKTRFAFIMDVFVDEGNRRKGIAGNMVRFAMEHAELRDVYSWMLGTQDAHAVYRKVGFGSLTQPENIMVLKKEKTRP